MATKQVSEEESHGAGAAADGLRRLAEPIGMLRRERAARLSLSPHATFRMNRDV
nr:hypothetical protein [uncultured Rhodopila sp.]